MTRSLHIVPAFVLVAFATGGCLDLIGANTPPECTVSTDCNTGAGEVCDVGTCWGDPPTGSVLAVVIIRPEERPDLVATEIPTIEISADGWMSDMRAEAAMTLHGRIEVSCASCPDGMSIAASIEVRRKSRIPGGKDYLATIESIPGVRATTEPGLEDDSFTELVPAIGVDDEPYEIRIVPSEAIPVVPDGASPAALVPPLRRTVSPQELADGIVVVLDADAVRAVNGRVIDALGQGIEGMRVSAVGRADPLRPLERVSTIAVTDSEGWYQLLLGEDVLSVVDLIAAPPADDVGSMPTLIAHDQFVAGTTIDALRMPSYPPPVSVTVPVVGYNSAGNPEPVPGARVQLVTIVEDAVPDPAVQAIFAVDTSTDSGGNIEAELIPGTAARARNYEVRIVPLANTEAAAATFPLEIGAQGGVQSVLALAKRAGFTGMVVDASGNPVENVKITAKPSLWFQWSLDADTQESLTTVDEPIDVTDPAGAFRVWVDPEFSGLSASYDLECDPGEGANVPRWTVEDVQAEMGAMYKEVGTIHLPDGAHVRGMVLDPDGLVLAGARVQVYEVILGAGACEAMNAPSECRPPAILRASGWSNEDGVVELVLPRH